MQKWDVGGSGGAVLLKSGYRERGMSDVYEAGCATRLPGGGREDGDVGGE